MRVLQILPSIKSAAGGPPRSTIATCRALHSAGTDTEIVLVTTDEGLHPEWHQEVLARLPTTTSIEVFPAHGLGAFLFSIPLLQRILQETPSFDLVVIHMLLHPLSSAAARVARSSDVPYVVVPHGTLSRYTFSHRRTNLKHLYYRLIEASTIERAVAMQFTTNAERDEALRLGIDTSSVVIPHPYESLFDRYDPVASNPARILFLGRFHPKKGIDLLIRAAELIRQELPDVRIVVAGSGTDDQVRAVLSMIERVNIEKAIELPGFVTGAAKQRLLREASVFLLPSKQENFGISVVEAMDAATPVVISRGVDIWPEVECEEAGVVVDPLRPDTLATATIELLKDRNRRWEMGRNGRRLVRSAFDPHRVGQQIDRFYQAAAQGADQVREAFR